MNTAGRAVLFAGITVVIALHGHVRARRQLPVRPRRRRRRSPSCSCSPRRSRCCRRCSPSAAGGSDGVGRRARGRAGAPERGPASGSGGSPSSSAAPGRRRSPRRRSCSRSPRPSSACGSATATPATTGPRRRPARPTTCSRRASARASTARSLVVAQLPRAAGRRRRSSALAHDARGARPTSPPSPGRGVSPAGDDRDDRRLPGLLAAERATTKLVDRSASSVLPPVDARTGATAFVGGATATQIDFSTSSPASSGSSSGSSCSSRRCCCSSSSGRC